MACQKLCKEGRDDAMKAKVNLLVKPHSYTLQCMRVFLKCTTSSQPLLAVNGCSLVLWPLPSPTWPGKEACMIQQYLCLDGVSLSQDQGYS